MPKTEPSDQPVGQRPDQATVGPRSRKGEETKARLVEAAKRVFEDAGFLDARISDIAKGAGLSHGSFYHYFDSKEQIFREIAEQQEELLTAPADEGDAADVDEFGRLLRANRRYLERYREHARIMGVIEEVSRYDGHVRDARMRRQKHFADRAERAIRRMQQDGTASAEIDAEIAAVALGAMVARFAEVWFTDGWGDYDFDAATRQLTLLWANAIGLDPGRG